MDAVTVIGPDARSFLQGQISQDMARVDRDGSAWTWILQPTGKVDALVRVSRVEADSYRLDVDAGFGDAVLARLARFKMRTKADLVCVANGGGALPYADDKARIEAGWPAHGQELTPETVPNETGLIPLTVSFTKGCYTGQELVARIDSRGNNVPKRLMRLRAEPGQTLTPGAPLVHDAKVVGAVTSAAGDVGLGYVGRSVEAGATLLAGDTTVVCEPIEHG